MLLLIVSNIFVLNQIISNSVKHQIKFSKGSFQIDNKVFGFGFDDI